MVRGVTTSAAQSAHADSPAFDAVVTNARTLLAELGASVASETVVVGCSGGVDSTVLLATILALGGKPVVVHVNYGLRGSDADLDAEAVVALASRWNLPVHIHRVPDGSLDARKKESLQEAARNIRYQQFAEAVDKFNATFVAVGHTLDDQAETLLLHVMRGTGMAGLGGMPPVRALDETSEVQLIRPLLSSSRSDVHAAATERGMTWREDDSNLSLSYARGRVRSVVVPAIDEAFGKERWLNFGRTANIVGKYLRTDHADDLEILFAETRASTGQALLIDVLVAQPPVWRRRLILAGIRRWLPSMPQTSDQLTAIESLLTSQVGKYVASGYSRITRERTKLGFHTTLPSDQASTIELLDENGSVRLGLQTIRWFTLAGIPTNYDCETRGMVLVDAAKLAAQLTVRRWKEGDRFVPLGLDGSKLVSDLLTDRKVRADTRKERLLVLSADKIVWCAGVEIAAEFRITAETRRSALLVLVDEGRVAAG